MSAKYNTGKYNPFKISEIIFKKESGYRKLIPDSYRKNSLFFVIIKSLYMTLRSVAASVLNPKDINFKDLYDNKLLFVLPTVNNQKALQNVIDIVQKGKDNVRVATENFYSILSVAFVSLFYLPALWIDFLKRTTEERRFMAYYLEHFVYTPGVVRFYFKTLKKYSPECIVLSNDHIYITKSLELVCEDLGIKTIYVQHASVSYAFPELHFTYSFLDGQDSLLKYTADGKKSTGNVIMLGAARYDSLSSYRINRKTHKRNCIGIAINLLDDNKTVNSFCNEILTKYPDIRIKIRSHPALKDKPFVFDNKDKIIYTCATDENIIDYLDSIDFQISGDSGVHFDAVIGGVNTVVFNFSNTVFSDNYGYVKNGFIKYADSIEQIFELAKCNPDVSLVRFYDESYQKPYSGKCSQIIAEFIQNGYNLECLQKYGLQIIERNNA